MRAARFPVVARAIAEGLGGRAAATARQALEEYRAFGMFKDTLGADTACACKGANAKAREGVGEVPPSKWLL